MKFKFQILDLFIITTCAASLAGAFRADLTLFRQLLCILLVALFSSAAVLLFSKTNHKVQFVGGVGGLAGGLFFLAIAFVLAPVFYDPGPFLVKRSLPMWFIDVPAAVILSVLFGATIGPLIAIRFQNRQISHEFRKPFWFSVVLISGIFLLGIFSMFDRQSMQDRNWQIVSLILSVIFVIHTYEWIGRFESERADPVEEQVG